MKLDESYAFLEEYSGSSGSSLTTTWFASWSSRRKREMRIAVMLRRIEVNERLGAVAARYSDGEMHTAW